MKKKTRTLTRFLIFALAIVIAGTITCTDSFAYFHRGNVNVSVGRGSVSLTQGGSASVSVSFSPSSSRQLPGCGMAECPQICGEKDCLDSNGECTSNGKTYKTYYPSASVSSSNTSVATASYGGGAVYINAISPGSATITITASLRQFSSTSKSISVTVSPKATQATQAAKATQAKNGQAAAKPVDKAAASKKNSKESESTSRETTDQSEESRTMDSDRGKIKFIQIPEGKTGKDALEEIKGSKDYVDFQKKDEADTILYAWEFIGTDVNDARDMDLNLSFSTKAFEGCSYGTEKDSLYIKRGDAEALPGEASTSMMVSDWFSGKDPLYLYSFDGEEGVSLLEEDLVLENGYVTSHAMFGAADKYILSTEKWSVEKTEAEAEGGMSPWIPIGIGVVIVAALAVIAVVRKRTLKLKEDK